jgi:hypothetical protein
MKYRYAWSETQQLVDILSLPESDLRIKYACLSCGQALTPKRGNIRVWHFAHRPQAVCSRETYLHVLGKQAFLQTYQACLKASRPFTLQIYQYPCWKPYAYLPGITSVCGEPRLRSYDLTAYYQQIELETKVGDFIPDLTLTGEMGVMFIEIAVTHQMGLAKQHSDYRILELQLKNEADVLPIYAGLLTERADFLYDSGKVSYPSRGAYGLKCFHFHRVVPQKGTTCGCAEEFVYALAVDKHTQQGRFRLMKQNEAAQLYLEREHLSFFACRQSPVINAQTARAASDSLWAEAKKKGI